jgi:hypothetical protein
MAQIAERVEIPMSTVHRLLATLDARRFLQRDKAAGPCRRGFQLVEPASLVLMDMDLPPSAPGGGERAYANSLPGFSRLSGSSACLMRR